MEVFIGLPAYNEEKNLPKILEQLNELNYNIIVCDDGSSDKTNEIAKKFNVNLIEHKQNLGYGASIKSIFQQAKQLHADILVTFDSDGQHDVNDIKNIIEPILNNNSDIVIGSRFLNKKNHIPKYRKTGINVITKITNSTINQKITDSQSGFRAYSKKSLEKIIPTNSGMGISTEILIKASEKDLKIEEIPIVISYEGETSTHNPITHGSEVIASTIKYIAIKRPLTFFGIPCLIFFIIGGIFGYITIENYIDDGYLNTNLAIISASLLFLSIILLITIIIIVTIITVIQENKNN